MRSARDEIYPDDKSSTALVIYSSLNYTSIQAISEKLEKEWQNNVLSWSTIMKLSALD